MKLQLKILHICLITILISTFLFGCAQGGQSTPQASGRFLELLKLMPDSFNGNSVMGTYITMTDYDKIRDVYGITLPTSEQGVKDYVEAILGVPTGIGGANGAFISGFALKFLPQTTAYPISSKYLGFDAFDVDAEIGEGGFGEALIGKFDPQATQNALNKRDEWPQWVQDTYATENYRNIVIHSWGDVFKYSNDPSYNTQYFKPFAPPHLDNLSQAFPLAVTQNNVFYSRSADVIKGMIDSSLGQTTSLADMPQYAAVAKGLSELGAYSAYLTTDDFLNALIKQSDQKDTSQAPLLHKYIALGNGVGKDDKGVYMALVMVHADAKSASDNLEILRTRINSVSWSTANSTGNWKQFVSDIQIHTEGNVLLAKLYGPEPKFWNIWFGNALPLLLHE